MSNQSAACTDSHAAHGRPSLAVTHCKTPVEPAAKPDKPKRMLYNSTAHNFLHKMGGGILSSGTLMNRHQAEDDGRESQLPADAFSPYQERSAELEAAKAQVEAILHYSPDCILLIKPDFTIQQANIACCRLLGVQPQEYIGQSFLRFISAEDTAFVKAFFQFDQGDVPGPPIELRAIHATTGVFDAELSIAPIKTDGFVCTMRNITQRKQVEAALRESEARYRLLAENVTDVITVSTPAGIRTYVTPSIYNLTGYTPEELIGQHLADSIHPDDAQKTLAMRKQTISAGRNSYTIAIRLRHRAGHYVWVESKVTLLYDLSTGALLESITVSRDITAHKQAEAAMQQAIIKEKELGDLKSRFVAMASHEFRTPLATILLATEVLLTYRHRLPDAKIEDKLNRIKEQVAHLKDIMEDVLLLARMQARRVTFHPVELQLPDLCSTIIDEFQSRPDIKHPLVYRCSGPACKILADGKLMQQIISNLLSNAIKYAPEDKPIHLDLTFTATAVRLQVQDKGIGIPAADLPYLFEPFHRAANVGTISGTGLGLVITKEAVELHGGTITVDSQLGVGTTFTVHLPLNADIKTADGS